MDGMHILTQIPIKEYTGTGVFFDVLAVVIIIGSMLIFAIRNRNRPKDKGMPYVLAGYSVGLIMIYASAVFCKAETGRYQYECLFDDSVTVNDIKERYDVVSFENGVWTIEDR